MPKRTLIREGTRDKKVGKGSKEWRATQILRKWSACEERERGREFGNVAYWATNTNNESKRTKCGSIHTWRQRERPLNYSNAPEEVLVWEEMDALTWVIHNEWNFKKYVCTNCSQAIHVGLWSYRWDVCMSQLCAHVFFLMRNKAVAVCDRYVFCDKLPGLCVPVFD